jgi:E3 SUMO-protein ligase PIAS1
VEFPPTCEVRVNNVQLTANLKGLKKKPGTAPPPDLGQSIRMNNGMQNRVDMVYVNSQQPIQPKARTFSFLTTLIIVQIHICYQKYYMIVCLVEATTVEQLVDKLKKGKYKSEEDIRAKSTYILYYSVSLSF